MGLYSEAIAAIRSMILIDERVKSLGQKVDGLAAQAQETRERLIRVETILEVAPRRLPPALPPP
jgi:hypothetical protein